MKNKMLTENDFDKTWIQDLRYKVQMYFKKNLFSLSTWKTRCSLTITLTKFEYKILDIKYRSIAKRIYFYTVFKKPYIVFEMA